MMHAEKARIKGWIHIPFATGILVGCFALGFVGAAAFVFALLASWVMLSFVIWPDVWGDIPYSAQKLQSRQRLAWAIAALLFAILIILFFSEGHCLRFGICEAAQ